MRYATSHGYPIEFVRRFDGTEDFTTSIIEFPCKAENALYADDMTAIQQLELVKQVQTLWADNSISVTVYYSDQDLEQIKAWLQENYSTSIKAVSFLRKNDHGFDQAPYEQITVEEYEKRVDNLLPLMVFNDFIDLDDENCQMGVCPIR